LSPDTKTDQRLRLRVAIRGAVQGVGFRPFVFRLADELGLAGWVSNSSQGVFLEAEGPALSLQEFLLRLETEKPPRSFIQSLESSWLDPVGSQSFEIHASETAGAKTTLVLPDIATCPECLREIFARDDRRFFYPFTNCTNCGPRFSIIESLPYDRANTSMKCFRMCRLCQAEYDDPRNRRFHAQPNACPVCGPQLQLWDAEGKRLRQPEGLAGGPSSEQLLQAVAGLLRSGKIVAVKGLGGFHLMVAAHDESAVRRLREKKHREEKPLALMFPTVESVKEICEVSPPEERLLRSPEMPIVLLRRRSEVPAGQRGCVVGASVAPGNPYLGVMLPYTPLHHLLLSVLGFPVVATSGNLSDEPICIEEDEAVERLKGIADLFLIHNRPIVRHVDDSIVRVMAGRETVLRRARGYAPLPVQMKDAKCEGPDILAVGAHLKNTVALGVGPQIFISQHIGDLETTQAYEAFRRVISDFERLYESRPGRVVADAHPDYLSTKFARELASAGSSQSEAKAAGAQTPISLASVQHHLAHVLSCMAENELEPPVLGVSWDGTGYGLDGTIWGGEFFRVGESSVERVAHFRPFRLPGGDQAIKEPRRTALGLLFEAFGLTTFEFLELPALQAFSSSELRGLKDMLRKALHSPRTSSAGRLFDAVASLAGIRQRVRFEGQAAMELEFALEGFATEEAYRVSLSPGPGDLEIGVNQAQLDWLPLLEAVLADLRGKTAPGLISARFHNGLVEAIVAVAQHFSQPRVVLTGGCFQNRYLTERAIRRLQEEGFRPYWHQRVPPNDGGIALGQIVAVRFGSVIAPASSRV